MNRVSKSIMNRNWKGWGWNNTWDIKNIYSSWKNKRGYWKDKGKKTSWLYRWKEID